MSGMYPGPVVMAELRSEARKTRLPGEDRSIRATGGHDGTSERR